MLTSLGYAIFCGYPIDENAKLFCLTAVVVVGKIGTASTTISEIIECESSLQRSTYDAKIKSRTVVAILARELKESVITIVFANG